MSLIRPPGHMLKASEWNELVRMSQQPQSDLGRARGDVPLDTLPETRYVLNDSGERIEVGSVMELASDGEWRTDRLGEATLIAVKPTQTALGNIGVALQPFDDGTIGLAALGGDYIVRTSVESWQTISNGDHLGSIAGSWRAGFVPMGNLFSLGSTGALDPSSAEVRIMTRRADFQLITNQEETWSDRVQVIRWGAGLAAHSEFLGTITLD